jgi:hypothetical protein
MSKPTEDLEWAESGSNVLEPSSLRPNGWPIGSPLASNHLNWLTRAMGRTASWVRDKFNTGGDLSLGALYGSIKLVADPPNLGAGDRHIFEHEATGTNVVSQFQADVLRGKNALRVGDAGLFTLEEDDDGLLSVVRHVCSGAGDTQLQSGSFAPLDSIPAHLNRLQALALGNMPKVAGRVRVLWDGIGDPSIVGVAGYNIASAALIAAAGTFPDGLTVTFSDDFTPTTIMLSIETVNSAAAALDGIFVGQVAMLNSSPRLRVTLRHWVSTTWANSLSNATTLGGAELDLNIVCF